jgi:hypothetical protein
VLPPTGKQKALLKQKLLAREPYLLNVPRVCGLINDVSLAHITRRWMVSEQLIGKDVEASDRSLI